MIKIFKSVGITLKKSMSLVLAFSIMISVSAIGIFSVDATSSSGGYVEVYFKNTSNWNKVYAYAWNSNDTENGSKKPFGEFPGTEMIRVGNQLYKSMISKQANKVIFSKGDNSGQTGDLDFQNHNGQMFDFSSNSWKTLDRSLITTKTYEYKAKKDSSLSSMPYLADISLYDYLDDQELETATWGNVKTAGNDSTWFPFNNFNNYLSDYYQANNIKKPVYFGNLNTGNATENDRKSHYNSYTKTLYNYDAAANNSKAVWYDAKTEVNVNDTDWLAECADPDSFSYSYQGVVSRNLGSGGSLQLMTNSNGAAAAPFFNDSFLSNNSLGRKVNTVLPFDYDESTYTYSYKSSTTSTHNSPINSIYLENSNRGTSTNNLNNVSSNSLTMKYGGNNTGLAILDGKLWFNSGNSGYGFFPLNNNQGSHTNNDVRNDLNYGFGMALTVNFTVPEDGCVPGTDKPITFHFTGDDDVWIFIDGKLVVDLGGDHKDASCTLNFRNNTTTYNTGLNKKAVTTNSTAYSLASVMSGSTNNTVHTLKMFCMERGLIESNISLEFSLVPLDNLLTTEKEVNTANLNSGLKEAVSDNEQFTIKNVSNGEYNNLNTTLGSKNYSLTHKNNSTSSGKTNSDGTYMIKDGDKASFTNITDTGNYLTVSESTAGSKLKYSTAYTVTDVHNNTVKAQRSGNSANFLFKNEVDDLQMTNYNVKFVNTPQVGDVSVSKTALDTNGTTHLSDKDFNFTITVDIGNGAKPYNLEYAVGSQTKTAANGRFTLRGDQTAVFKNIPVGATYTIVEDADADYTTSPSNRTITGTVGTSSNTAEFTNTKIDKTDASVVIEANKLLDGKTPDVNSFNFTLTELTRNGSTLSDNGTLVDTKTNNGGKVTFDTITYPYEDISAASIKSDELMSITSSGIEYHYYEIAETAGYDSAYTYDTVKYYAAVTVDRSAAPNTASVKYYNSKTGAVSGSNEITPDQVVFNNYHKGSIEVTKKDASNGNTINDSVKFKLYKVSGNGSKVSESNLIEEKTVDSNGKVLFENLDIFVDQANNDTSAYQWYCIIESQAKDGYNINSTQYYFTIPLSQRAENQSTTDYNFESDGVKYEFVLDNEGNPVYNIKCDVDNFLAVTPDTSGSGINIFFVIGLGIVGTGAVLTVSYLTYDRVQRRRRRARQNARRY